MKDDAQGMAPSFAQRADAVAHGNAIGAASALDGAVVDGEAPNRGFCPGDGHAAIGSITQQLPLWRDLLEEESLAA